jgi:putative transposase
VGKKTGRNPTDRGKLGSKRSLLTDGRGVPLGLAIAGANRNDHKLMRETIEAMPVERPAPSSDAPQGLCLDKGYDCDEVRDLAAEFGFTLHLRTRGEEIAAKQEAGTKARRWVVERTHSWLNRFRRILVRWEKRPDTYLAMLHFALGLIAWRHVSLAWIIHENGQVHQWLASYPAASRIARQARSAKNIVADAPHDKRLG